MSDFNCIKCGQAKDSVELVEHGTDDMPLCKTCFKTIRSRLG